MGLRGGDCNHPIDRRVKLMARGLANAKQFLGRRRRLIAPASIN